MTKAQNADYAHWARFFGKSTRDPELVAAFRDAGIAKTPVIARDDFEESEDIGALTVSVRDPSVFGDHEGLGRGIGIFSVITLHLKQAGDKGYTGPLPYSVDHEDSRASLRKKLGPPEDSDEDDEPWDEWTVDGRKVVAFYTSDFKGLDALTVMLPEED
ncbi:hypothetical protein FKV24_010765 [Lysobacter maris]|uniref:Uncharacterized protein n=1 Tax=Marilutibacter maris TaxID=1605891 RepID=A0A508AMQ9_9GAMM|nr:hypothetical protein [Lysobacter maris]KAB8185245.1 hypothetical protein FKV24_010765 [Lysobacter maris]